MFEFKNYLILGFVFAFLYSNTGKLLANEDKSIGQVRLPLGFSGVDVSVKPEKVLRRQNLTSQKYDYSCGSAALATALNSQFDLGIEEQEVITGLLKYGEIEKIKSGRRFSLLDMKSYLSHLGIKSAGYTAGIEDIGDVPDPAIISISIKDFKHFVVFTGYKDGHVLLSDPAFGNMSVSLNKFASMWSPKVFFVLGPNTSLLKSTSLLSKEKLRFVRESIIIKQVSGSDNTQDIHTSRVIQKLSMDSAKILRPRN